jgi:site-specific recombinase XerD
MKTKLRLYEEKLERLDYLLSCFTLCCEAKSLSSKTISWYNQMLKQFFRWLLKEFGIERTREVTAEHLKRYFILRLK